MSIAAQIFGQCLLGLALSSVIGWLALRRSALTRSGVAGAIVTGTLTFGFGGIAWGAALIVFFASSTALGYVGKRRKAMLKTVYEKSDQRDLGQVLANGGLAALLALVHGIQQITSGTDSLALWAAYLASLAAVNADTWATELGALSNTAPRLITTLQQVSRGTSGGVTLTGLLASLMGGLLIGLVGLLANSPALAILTVGAAGGLFGSLADSLLGATVQAMFVCGDQVIEKPICPDGSAAQPIRGRVAWINNDVVNFAASMIGALMGVFAYQLLK